MLFLFAIGTSSGPAVPTLLAALAGLAVAVAIGYAIFAAGVRIDLRRFFTITGVVLIFVSAGLVAFAIHEFGEAGLITNTGDGLGPRRDPARVQPARVRCWPGCSATGPRRRRSRSSATSPT